VTAADGRQPRRLGVLLEPAPAILLAAAVVHVIRQNVFDVVVFVGVVLVIVVDRFRQGPEDAHSPARLPVLPRWVSATAVAAFGVLVGWLPLASGPLRVILGVIGLGALLLVAAARPPAETVGGPAPAQPGWALWAVTLLLAALLELANFLQQPDPETASYPHPTLSALLGPELAGRPVRMIALACWLAGLLWIARACVARPAESENAAEPKGQAGG
jgi:hypothetical protein